MERAATDLMEAVMKISKTAAVSVVALCVSAGALAAQGLPKRDVGQATILAQPEIIAGPDVGFRVGHYTKDGIPVGELVVKKDGKWVPVEFGAKMKMVK